MHVDEIKFKKDELKIFAVPVVESKLSFEEWKKKYKQNNYISREGEKPNKEKL